MKFDGKKVHAREHIFGFLYNLDLYANDHDLKMKEFSKSLTNLAYSWFVKLLARSVYSWDKLVAAFCTSFFVAQWKINLAILVLEVQKIHESLTNYVNKFKEITLDYNEIMGEKELI